MVVLKLRLQTKEVPTKTRVFRDDKKVSYTILWFKLLAVDDVFAEMKPQEEVDDLGTRRRSAASDNKGDKVKEHNKIESAFISLQRSRTLPFTIKH